MAQKLSLDVFLLCFNEEKMIRHTINYYKSLENPLLLSVQITVLDNESTDRTLEILQKEYPDVEIHSFSTNGKMNDAVHMYLKNNCWKGSKADWCIVADMDELLWHSDFIGELQRRKNTRQSLPKVEGFQMYSETFLGDYTRLITDQAHRGLRDKDFDKYILICPSKIEVLRYGPGSHTMQGLALKWPQKELQAANALVFKENFKLLHYKYLGEQYLIDKHRALAARLSDQNKANGWCWEYEKGDEEVIKRFQFLRDSGKVVKVI